MKLGIALSGSDADSYFSAGALAALEKNHIKYDMIAASSAQALVASYIVDGIDCLSAAELVAKQIGKDKTEDEEIDLSHKPFLVIPSVNSKTGKKAILSACFQESNNEIEFVQADRLSGNIVQLNEKNESAQYKAPSDYPCLCFLPLKKYGCDKVLVIARSVCPCKGHPYKFFDYCISSDKEITLNLYTEFYAGYLAVFDFLAEIYSALLFD